MSNFEIAKETCEQQIDAVREFTDREDPQEAFERKVRVLCQNRKSFYVLSYYGIGGIGKTSFVNKLCRMINGEENSPRRLPDKIDCDYVKYDFGAEGSEKNKRSILLSLRNQLVKCNKDFVFDEFDAALMAWAEKSGVDLTKDTKTASIIENKPWAKVFMALLNVTTMGTASNFMQLADTVYGTTVDEITKKKCEKFKKKYEYLEANEIEENLHIYFIHDMKKNMFDVAIKPLIIFLDTYERYVDTLGADNVIYSVDHWLRRGKHNDRSPSVIQSIPGVLWVITGREKLNWSIDDDVWDEVPVERPLGTMTEDEKEELAKCHLEQHLLGDLSEKDSVSFLDRVGVGDVQLQKQLYHLTSGTPLYLNLCVAQYKRLIEQGRVPHIDEFGKDYKELIERYLKNMPSYAREMARFLACVEKWTDSLLEEILKRVSCLKEFTQERYEEFIKHSFIVRDGDNTYYMHKTVRNAVYQNTGKEIKRVTCLAKLSIYEEYIRDEKSISFGNYFAEYMEELTSGNITYEELLSKKDIIFAGFQRIEKSFGYYLHLGLSKRFVNYTYKVCVDKEMYLVALEILAISYERNGYHEAALRARREVYDRRVDERGKMDSVTMEAMSDLACSCLVLEKYAESLNKFQAVYDYQSARFGEDNLVAMGALLNLANAYCAIAQIEEALPKYEKVYNWYEKELGENAPATIDVLNNIAVLYMKNEKYEEALSWCKAVYDKRVEQYGAEHPATIDTRDMEAYIYILLKRYEEALPICEEVYEKRVKRFGEEYPATIDSANDLIEIYEKTGKFEDAKRIYDRHTRR